MAKTQKFRNVAHNDKVAFVVDDIASRHPQRVRRAIRKGDAAAARRAQRQLNATPSY